MPFNQKSFIPKSLPFYQKSLEKNIFEQKSLDQKSLLGQEHPTFDAKEKFFLQRACVKNEANLIEKQDRLKNKLISLTDRRTDIKRQADKQT